MYKVTELIPMARLVHYDKALLWHKQAGEFRAWTNEGEMLPKTPENYEGFVPFPFYSKPPTLPVAAPKYQLGARSLKELIGVNPKLVRLVKRAIEITDQDFTVYDGIRSVEEQRALVAKGASKTMDSKHLTGNAVDLVPYVNGKLRWEWPLIFPIAEAMRRACLEQSVPLRWGGCWQNIHNASNDVTMEGRYEMYINSGGTFPDGVHFELYENGTSHAPDIFRDRRVPRRVTHGTPFLGTLENLG